MFLNIPTQRIVPGIGNPKAKICIIGDAPCVEDDRVLRPFSGAAGTVLESCLHAAGLTKNDCYITNVIKERPRKNELDQFFDEGRGTFTLDGARWLDSLESELSGIASNVLVPVGSLAMAAITGGGKISKYRGYVTKSLPRYGERKVIPTYHPSATIRGQYILRYYISADMRKAKTESAYPEIVRPDRKIIIPTTIAECIEWLEFVRSQPMYCSDIEVMNFEVSAVGFSTSPDLAISIPFNHNHWNEDDEVVLWAHVAKTYEAPGIKKLFQNGIFDIHFLATQCGIHVAPPIEDSMMAHSVMYPEMLKGLGFLGSLYCGAQEYWKDAMKWDNIKEES